MKHSIKNAALSLLMIAVGSITLHAQTATEVKKLQKELQEFKSAAALVKQHLNTFDTLDYTVFSGKQWARFHESHGENIKVFWPDGHVVVGLAKHIEDMKDIFVYAPDARIKQHQMGFGSGNLTAVTGLFEGTFTQPMPIGNGKFIQPTGKKFSFPMATVGVWKDGVMIEEHLYWNNKAFMEQIGLGK